MKKQTIFLIDGSSFLYRAYYGIRPLHTQSGEAIHAVYGFYRMIHKLIKVFEINHIAVVWDSKGKTHRHEILSSYKANRLTAPSDLFSQKDHIQEIANLINLAQINKTGLEADDILYSLAKDYSLNHDVVIVTSDKDLTQALQTNIKIYDSFKDKMIDQDACEEKYGFPIKKMPFYFALIGDASDNISGVKGIGPKTAVEIVNQFDSLTALYENIDFAKVSPRIKNLLIENKENAFLSKQLFTLRYEKQNLKLEEIEFKESNWQRGLPLFQKLEFNQLIKDLHLQAEEDFSLTIDHKPLHELYNFQCITTEQQLLDLVKTLEGVDEFALDTETKGLDPMQDKCIGLSIAYKEGLSFYIPFGHETNEEQINLSTVQKYLNPILQNKSIKKILHHAAFDYIALQQSGMVLENIFFDTLVAAGLVNKPWQKKGLKELSMSYFNEAMISFSEIMKKYKAKTFANIPLQDATNYAAADAHQTLKLKNVLDAKLTEFNSEKIFYNIEMPLVPILANMQIAGIYCDPSLLHHLNIQVTNIIDQIVAEIFNLTQITINLNSPKQVAQLLFENLNLPMGNKGNSTNVDVLEKLAKNHPVPKLILKYRELSKLKNTYLESLPASINPTTHRIHSSFNQALVATGRLSSSNPNLQNIPTSKDINIRASFKATENQILVSADYSQIELRVLAQLSQDPALLEAFKNDQDIHTQTAAFIFQLPEGEISSEQRSIGKKINFSVLYGLTAYSLSGDLNISFKDAKFYIDSYFNRYAQVKIWMDETVQKAKKLGYVETFYGRIRWIPEINDNNRIVFEAAKRIAINTPVQGTAAEIMKIGMIKTIQKLKAEQVTATLLLQVHDEIIFSVHKNDLEHAKKIIQEELESVADWSFPLKVSVQWGNSWSSLSK